MNSFAVLYICYYSDDAQKLIEEYGGKVAGAISGKTNYLLAGEEAGPSKLAKAKEKNIKIINEGELTRTVSYDTYTCCMACVNLFNLHFCLFWFALRIMLLFLYR